MPSYDDQIDQSLQAGEAGSMSGAAPELGGHLRSQQGRSGLEPELGGTFRQNGVYVDEVTCIGCRHCALVARNTFYIEEGYGRSRVFRQDGDAPEVVQEAIDTCPVDCIHWVNYEQLKVLEKERRDQVIPMLGSSVDPALKRKRRSAIQRQQASKR
jgi:ferredoxin